MSAHVLGSGDTPHRIALGAAIGTFIAMTPTVGLHTLLAVALAALVRANKVAAAAFVWVANPVTMIPMYALAFWLGCVLLPGPVPAGGAEAAGIPPAAGHAAGVFWPTTMPESLTAVPAWMLQVGEELWIGALVLGAAGGGVAYGLTRWAVRVYRARRQRHNMDDRESGAHYTSGDITQALSAADSD